VRAREADAQRDHEAWRAPEREQTNRIALKWKVIGGIAIDANKRAIR
jgi:hypothetical protein